MEKTSPMDHFSSLFFLIFFISRDKRGDSHWQGHQITAWRKHHLWVILIVYSFRFFSREKRGTKSLVIFIVYSFWFFFTWKKGGQSHWQGHQKTAWRKHHLWVILIVYSFWFFSHEKRGTKSLARSPENCMEKTSPRGHFTSLLCLIF